MRWYCKLMILLLCLNIFRLCKEIVISWKNLVNSSLSCMKNIYDDCLFVLICYFLQKLVILLSSCIKWPDLSCRPSQARREDTLWCFGLAWRLGQTRPIQVAGQVRPKKIVCWHWQLCFIIISVDIFLGHVEKGSCKRNKSAKK